MTYHLKEAFFVFLLINCGNLVGSQSPRSLLSWQRDLDYRLNAYYEKMAAISDILATSIYPGGAGSLVGPTKISGVRFTNLIVPSGSLVLNSPIASSTVSILVNKTQSYVNSKMSDLFHIRGQLNDFKRQLNDSSRRFIYKGTPNVVSPQSIHLSGIRVFKQFLFGRLINGNNISLRTVNRTDVNKVLAATYMENPGFGLRDHRSRLFFEGKKTFWKTVFQGHLNSGCCDRLKPLHTNRMMVRSKYQEISAPILFHTNTQYNQLPIRIRSLTAGQLSNRIIAVGLISGNPNDIGLFPSPQENFISPLNLLTSRGGFADISYKTLIFKDTLMVEQALLATTNPDGKTIIDVVRPEIHFDISHTNYLLRNIKQNSLIQNIEGSLIINGKSMFSNIDLETQSVNDVWNFNQFVQNMIVKVDTPANITGLVQFNALPSIFNSHKPSIPLAGVPIINVIGPFDVGLINGMRLPNDIVILPSSPAIPMKPIVVRGSRMFANQLIFRESLEVRQLVNNLQIPAGVIPLHLNDPINSLGFSNLWFLDGIMVGDLNVESRVFGDINLSETHGNAQNIIMRSMIAPQPDGTHIIKAPLHILNLRLVSQEPNKGMLNGFKPQSILELLPNSNNFYQIIQGRKVFMEPVEAIDCLFGEINLIANWTNHLIRIDRPKTVQTVHSRLAFLQPPAIQPIQSNLSTYGPTNSYYSNPSTVAINNLQVEFLPNNDPLNYMSNLELSPEFYVLHQALISRVTNGTEGRIRVEHLQLSHPYSTINGVALDNIVTLDTPFRFSDRFVMVGKVEVSGTLAANRIISSYPIDSMDLVQFENYRIPINRSPVPIKLNNLLLSTNNRAPFVQCYMINGIKFTDFANSIMSLTKPQLVDSKLIFDGPVNLEGIARTQSIVNGIKDFRSFAGNLKRASYSFENGLQCNSVTIKT